MEKVAELQYEVETTAIVVEGAISQWHIAMLVMPSTIVRFRCMNIIMKHPGPGLLTHL